MLSVKRNRAFLLKITSALFVSALSPASAYAEHENDGVNPGWSQCRSINPDERIKGCDQVISAVEKETKHNQLAAYINRASAYQAKGDLAKAILDYSKALEVDASSLVALTARGAAYYATRAFDKAIADYDKVIDQDKS
ncbi:MAG: tetratricopeptide repeat protein, partial [Methylocystis sp.]